MTRTARKTTTSTEVKRRYNDRVYCKVQAELPRDTVTAFKAKCKRKGETNMKVLNISGSEIDYDAAVALMDDHP